MTEARTPVVIGVGQINQKHCADEGLHPVALMAEAARAAAPQSVLRAVDSVRVVNLLSWRYRDPGRLLAEELGAAPPTTHYSGVGGNVPQSLVNQACLDIQAGRNDVVLLAGAESWRTRMRLRAEGTKPDWPRQPESVAPTTVGADVPMVNAADELIGLDRPAFVYPLFEQAIRIANGSTIDNHRRRMGLLWSQFSAVAAGNEHAWSREQLSPDQIWESGPNNRMISWPYTKLLNSNNMVDQGAAILVCSLKSADRLKVDRDRRVFPWSGTDGHDTYAIAERFDYARSPAIRIAGTRALAMAGLGIDDIELVDLYSCFPSAVQIAAAELGLPIADPSRPLTVTGGLTFAGGPWNNYVMHAIATMTELLVGGGAKYGLVTANGGYLTKHSVGVYGSEPSGTPFMWEDVQPLINREPTRKGALGWEGRGVVESWTAPFSRDGLPEKAFVAVRTPDGARALAVIGESEAAAAAVERDLAGVPVKVAADGFATLL